MTKHDLTKQTGKAIEAADILSRLNIVYLIMEMRTQKTPTALMTCQLLHFKDILIVTKKKAIKGVEFWCDYLDIKADRMNATVINYESLHKLTTTAFDVIILDEAHTLGTITPRNTNKKNSFQLLKNVENLCVNKPIIYLSGTPHPESPTQLFSQFNISSWSPFSEKKFMDFVKTYVDVKQKMINGYKINDYTKAKTELIYEKIEPYLVKMTLEEAGAIQFKHIEQTINVELPDVVKQMIKKLLNDKIIKVNGRFIVCETAASEKSKVLQICSGTVLDEERNAVILHHSKIDVIKLRYKEERIGIFYNFRAERDELLKYFKDEITENNDDFQSGKKRIYITQITSGAEGVDLSTADRLVYYNLCHSGKAFMQSKARHSSLKREKPLLIDYLFSDVGAEQDVMKSLQKKENYTTLLFNRFKQKMMKL